MEENKKENKEEDEESEGDMPHSLVKVGDIELQSRSKSLKLLRSEVNNLLRSKNIKNYLNNYKEQSLFKGASYID